MVIGILSPTTLGPIQNVLHSTHFLKIGCVWGYGSGCLLVGKAHVCVQFISCPELNSSGQGNGFSLLHGNTETELFNSNIDFL